MFHKKQMIWFNPSDRFLGESFVKNKTKIRSKQLLAVIYPFEHILWFTGTNRHFLRNRHLSIYNFKEIFKSRTSIRFFYAIYITRSHLSRSRTCFFSFLIKIRPLTVQRRCFAYKIDFTPFDRANIFLSFAVGWRFSSRSCSHTGDRPFVCIPWLDGSHAYHAFPRPLHEATRKEEEEEEASSCTREFTFCLRDRASNSLSMDMINRRNSPRPSMRGTTPSSGFFCCFGFGGIDARPVEFFNRTRTDKIFKPNNIRQSCRPAA